MHTRSHLSLVGALFGSAVLALAVGGVALAAETVLTANLTGGEEVPAGDEDGSGTATITVDPEAGTLCYEITVENIEPATASHIHEGGPGVAGDVVVPLDVDGFDGSTEGCIEPMEDAQVLQDIVDDPAGYYVNVHNDEFPGGAVRGQLAASTGPDTATAPSTTPVALVGLIALVIGASALLVLQARPR
ncbi:MAG: CHRD domain-containing protein [Chloroflexota bacterium]|nr:CHRD domain-containing protein [Chloroflexota bacterium]